ncbi:sugar kinase [Merismopedia glauca]|uniref:Ribokinase n=1 Tax=Merismopedia glauca CCAP 1448/3 TaxID=1296344 RepID=A0A2T1C412_9CYAN|nr:sugar kinase [Merismopedia glauca]PSB02964.1 ribokinase [Merismopedia glauca CCAP 1448/3]
MTDLEPKYGLFVGLITWDLIYLATSVPTSNQKIVASNYTVGSGGPATNAAICFNHLGNRTKLVAIVGNHPISQLIQAELTSYGIELLDLAGDSTQPPPISSIIVTQGTGERAVISINAIKNQISPQSLPEGILEGVNIILLDGHQMELAQYLASLAQKRNIPVVIDGGSWKPGWEKVLPYVDYAICSANFLPPGCRSQEEVFGYLTDAGVTHIAITNGENPIRYESFSDCRVVLVPQIQAVDTLGAGDIFHGAFCHYILQTSFPEALAAAAQVAANSCQFFGTKLWMDS